MSEAAIGRSVRAARQAAGLSLRQLAAAVGVSRQQVQKYEQGVDRLPASRAILIAKTLQVRVDHLLGADPPARSTAVANSPPML